MKEVYELSEEMNSPFKASASYRPFVYQWAVDSAHKQEVEMYWHIGQVNLQDDAQQYFSKNGLATANVSHEQNKTILDRSLCLFTEMDKNVADSYVTLMPYFKNNEIRCSLLRKASREVTHQQAYALAAETFGFSDKDWIAFADYKEMRDKLDALAEQFDGEHRDEVKATLLLSKTALGEGIGLFGMFATLLNQKRYGILIGFNDINEWSLKDEQEHYTDNVRIIKECYKVLTPEELKYVRKKIREFIEKFRQAEHRYLELVFEMGGAEGLTLDQMKAYIDYLCSLRAYQLDLLSIDAVLDNPLEWMDWILSGSKVGNFFEKKVTEYVHGALPGVVDYSKYLHILEEKEQQIA